MDPRLNKLALNPKTHVLITMSGGEHFISDRVNRMLGMASLDDMIELDDKSKIKVSTIASIVPLSEYYQQNPSKKPDPSRMQEQDDYFRQIADEARASAAKRKTEVLVHVLKKLKVINQDPNASYSHLQLQKAIEEELKNRNYRDEQAYSFEEIQREGFMGIINGSSVDGIKAMMRGMDRYLSKNPHSPKAKMLRMKMVEALNKKTNETQSNSRN